MQVIEKYRQRVDAVNSLLCVGLDSDISILGSKQTQFEFNRRIIEETHPFVVAYKPNIAFYEAQGVAGLRELELTMEYLHDKHPDILTIADAKRADIGSTNQSYVTAYFDHYGFDAITLHPYLGKTALYPFLARADKACIILCRTSNEGAGEFQEMLVDGKALWQRVAENVAQEWDDKQNCMLVVGATQPEVVGQVRQIVGDMPLLIPGVGAQGGDLEAVLKNGLDSQRSGLIVNASRSIIFAENPAQEAEALQKRINLYR